MQGAFSEPLWVPRIATQSTSLTIERAFDNVGHSARCAAAVTIS